MIKIYRNLKQGAMRYYSNENVYAWRLAEESLGLKKSIFITINGMTQQYYDADEGEKFYNWLKKELENPGFFPLVCERYYEALMNKNKVKIFESLTIFNEIDEHPEIADNDIHRRLKRIRESTHEEIYKL